MSHISGFSLQEEKVWCLKRETGHCCRSPADTLFSLLCFGAQTSCSNFCPYTRCESLLHNKYRKGVLVCVCEMWQVCVCMSSLFYTVLLAVALSFPSIMSTDYFYACFLSAWGFILTSSATRFTRAHLLLCDEWNMKPHGEVCERANVTHELFKTSLAVQVISATWSEKASVRVHFLVFCHADVRNLTSCCYTVLHRGWMNSV